MSEFVADLERGSIRQDGIAVARLLSIKNLGLGDLAYYTNEASVDRDLRARFEDNLWGDIAVAHWKVAMQVVIKQDLIEAYSAQNALLVALNRAAERTDNWILPVMFLVAKELRQLSIMADAHLGKDGERKGAHEAKLEEATRSINRSFTLCLNDRNQNLLYSRKWGVYFFVGELFKIYFKLNKRPLAKSVLKVLQTMSVDLPPLEKFPKSHSATFLYYWGVLLFIDEVYVKAEEKLTEALELCHKSALKNQENILIYLIPAKLLNSKVVPSSSTLSTFPRLDVLYSSILKAVITGDLASFDSEIQIRKNLFVKKYLYLYMERLRTLVWVQLLKKVYLILDKTSRISVSTFRQAFVFSQRNTKQQSQDVIEYDDDQVECLIANMIYTGRVKGYISRERGMIVLSNKDAFP